MTSPHTDPAERETRADEGIRTMKALSIRQPWANLIVLAGKDIENRTWATRYRGPILIHAGQGMTYRELAEAEAFARVALGREAEPFGPVTPGKLYRGGIVGVAEIVDCVRASTSPWFMGPVGFVLANARPLPFRVCKGQLGFFDVALTDDEAALLPAPPIPARSADLFG